MSRFSHTQNDSDTNQETKKDCKACFDFKDWLKGRKHETEKKKDDIKYTLKVENKRLNCPLYRDELGRSTWGLLHTMAAYYPEKPTDKQETQMENFIDGLATFFPCEECASDFQDE
jgi:FAD-linked sulfhydryl oxidase